MAVLAWQQHVKDERNWEGALVAAKREKECEAINATHSTCLSANLHIYSILARLIEMGYSEDDFPENSYDSAQWRSLVSQPRELTEQSTYHALPALKPSIQFSSTALHQSGNGFSRSFRSAFLRQQSGENGCI